MNDSYSAMCDYGGIGNFQEGDTACMLCPHEVECSHEQELAELESSRSRRMGGGWRYPNRSSSLGTRRTAGGIARKPESSSLQPSGLRRSRRPMPIQGENPFMRASKNIFMTMLAAGFHEAGNFCEEHDFAHVVDGHAVPMTPAPEKKKE